MPDLQYGLGTFDRDRGNFPEIPVVNMFAEQVPIENVPAVLQSRSGLENTGTTLGTGPVKAIYKIEGVLSNQRFAISGGHLYANTTDLGAINGTGPARIAGFQTRVFACQGQTVYQYDGASLTTVAMPGGFDVTSICVGSDRLIVIDKNTGHFYWSNVLNPTVDALSFATAENTPDNLKDCLFVGDTLLLFGTETVEQWPVSSANADLPYTPLVGRTFQVGIRDTGCCTAFQNTFIWITNHNQICAGTPDNIISDAGLEEKISTSTTASTWTFRLEGTEFLAVRLDTKTYVFNARSSQWSTFESYGQTNWIPQCYGDDVFGSSIDGRLIQWSSTFADFNDVLERRFRAGLAITANSQPLSNLILRTNPGQTPYLSGTYSNPTVTLRTSRDGGFTWSNWKSRSLGVNGKYRANVAWRSLGYFGYPSMLVEIRLTDPVPFRVSGVTVNEVGGSI